MLNLNRSYDRQIENAYIITIKDNERSEQQSFACQESCREIDQDFRVWQAFDGTDNKTIKVPPQCEEQPWLSWFKVTDHELSISEVACALSHISLWIHCLTIEKPIVILEHDAIMLREFKIHNFYNSIVFLGCVEQKKGQFPILNIPPHGRLNHNYHMLCRAHAYAIDPLMAANLVSHVMKHGIHESLDVMIRPELFSIVQDGLFAFDNFQGTTITNRKKDPQGNER